MADEEKKDAPKSKCSCSGDCRTFFIALLTSIIVVLAFNLGIKAFRILCASCRGKAAPAAVCGKKAPRPGRFCPAGRPGLPPPECGMPRRMPKFAPKCCPKCNCGKPACAEKGCAPAMKPAPAPAK